MLVKKQQFVYFGCFLGFRYITEYKEFHLWPWTQYIRIQYVRTKYGTDRVNDIVKHSERAGLLHYYNIGLSFSSQV